METYIKPYDSYLFDNDGTLFDTVDLICTCFQYVAEKNAGKTMDKGTIFVTWSHAERCPVVWREKAESFILN